MVSDPLDWRISMRDNTPADARHGGAYLSATGGAAYLLSKAIHEFELRDFPVTVAVDSQGHSIHKLIPAH